MANQYSEQLSNPTVESSLRQWHEYDGLHRMVGTVCPHCKRMFFPKRFVCTQCHSLDVQPFTFSGKGTLINVSRQLLPPTRIMGFREDAIRIMVGVKLEEGPVVMSELVDCLDDVDKLIGKPVHYVIRKLARSANGDYKYGYKFKLSRQLSEPAL